MPRAATVDALGEEGDQRPLKDAQESSLPFVASVVRLAVESLQEAKHEIGEGDANRESCSHSGLCRCVLLDVAFRSRICNE